MSCDGSNDNYDIDSMDESTGSATDEQSGQDGSQSKTTLDQTLARKETNAVHCTRILVFLVLVSAAVLVSVAVYLYMKRDEEDAFEEQFYDLAYRLVEGFHANAKLRVQVLDILAVSLTSSAMATDQVWPFVTMPDFDARATAARAVLGSQYIGVYPYVSKELRKPWEEYTQDPNNIDWLNESFAYQEDFLLTHGRSSEVTRETRALMIDRDLDEEDASTLLTDDFVSNNITYAGTYGSNPSIFRAGDPDNPEDDGAWVNEDEDAPGPFYPMWQISPVKNSTIWSVNYNVMDPYYPGAYINTLGVVQSKGEAVFGGVWNVDEDGQFDENDDYDYRVVPAASLQYPIFDKIVGNDKKVVAILDLDYEFGPFFSAVLPPNANTITCVVTNCDQVFTYEITGESAVYLGAEDMHDGRYDAMFVTTIMTDFDKSAAGTVYNGPPVNKDYCPWELKVYATQDMEDAYVTSRPLYYMGAVLGIFLFTCLTFLFYDWLVEHRQKKVMKTAVNSDKIVSSLFPKTFRDALYQRENDAQRSGKVDKMKNLLMGESEDFRVENVEKLKKNDTSIARLSVGGSDPLAELYNHCTVFFADIAGFTAWSSARSPTQVFKLLETLYGAFDVLARKHKVFKIETIGDCYVAVTGLPEPQPNHALLMVKFARACLAKMPHLTRKLEKILGPDTGELAMRVGLHSGPVTAGILRGDKQRFQLFGDTVNTAARMESNGKKFCIHCSQETADVLSSMGKGDWVFAREDKIHAKGKGELQTFWIKTNSVGSVGSSSFEPSETSLDDDDDDTIEVEEVLAEKHVSAVDCRIWAEKNFRSIGWLVDSLLQELGLLVFERKGRTETEKVAWDTDLGLQDCSIIWHDSLLQELTSSQGSDSIGEMISIKVQHQLKRLVILLSYKCNRPFHSVDHACQVFMSADRMLQHLSLGSMGGNGVNIKAWVKFTVLFASLIRDVDPAFLDGDQFMLHSQGRGANCYRKSLNTAWDLLMDDCFADLRNFLCVDTSDFQNFRQLLVNLVLAGDLSTVQRAEFGGNVVTDKPHQPQQVASVLEKICVASQWTHTMQHCANYKKWSDQLYQEAFPSAGVEGEGSGADGSFSDVWHQHQLTVLKDVIIPLGEKLESPSVLGALGNELLKYAVDNCRDLEAQHQAVVTGVALPYSYDDEIEI